jgi:hypothetical protein
VTAIAVILALAVVLGFCIRHLFHFAYARPMLSVNLTTAAANLACIAFYGVKAISAAREAKKEVWHARQEIAGLVNVVHQKLAQHAGYEAAIAEAAERVKAWKPPAESHTFTATKKPARARKPAKGKVK